MPTLGDLWNALSDGPDAMPPLIHLATRIVGEVAGYGHVSVRFPAIVGFWLMCMSLYCFSRRRMPSVPAAMVMVMPLTTPIYEYAIEARGYGLAIGLVGAAIVSWDLANERRWRYLSRIMLPICLAAAIASHLYAILIIVPLSIAEVVRTASSRRVNWWVWVGIASSGLVFLPLGPLLPNMRRLGLMMAQSKLGFYDLMGIWPLFLSSAAMYLSLLACIYLRIREDRDELSPVRPMPSQCQDAASWMLVIGLSVLPVVGLLFARVVTGVLLYRYVLSTSIGVCLLVGFLCWRCVASRPEFSLLLLACVLMCACGSILERKRTMAELGDVELGRGRFRIIHIASELPDDELPIVISDFHAYMQIFHYVPESLRQRLVFLPDFEEWVKPYASAYNRLFKQRMQMLDEFSHKNHSFYFYECDLKSQSPMLAKLVSVGAALRDSGVNDGVKIYPRPGYLYCVTLPQ